MRRQQANQLWGKALYQAQFGRADQQLIRGPARIVQGHIITVLGPQRSSLQILIEPVQQGVDKLYRIDFKFMLRLQIFQQRPEAPRSEEHTSELQSRGHLVCRLLLEKKHYDSVQA